MELSKHKTYLFNGVEELKKVSAVLQKNNSSIEESNKLLTFGKYPFMTGLTLSNEIKEKIRKKFSERARETSSILLSLVSVLDLNTKKRHHLISVEITNEEIGDYYLNYNFLAHYLRFSRYTLNNMSTFSSIDRLIPALIDEINNRGRSSGINVGNQGNHSDMGLELSIERLKGAINSVYGGQYKTDDEYFLFSIDNVKFKFASDYMSVDNHYYSGSKLLYNFYRSVYNRTSKSVESQPSLIRYIPKDIFSESQKNAFMSMNKAVNLVIGAGGSGKTYMAKIMAERVIELNAILHAQGSKEVAPLLYTTFSKGSLQQFMRYCQNGGVTSKSNLSSLIYSRNENVLNDRLSNLSENCDRNRYMRIEGILKGMNITMLPNNLEIQTKTFESISTFLEYIIMSKDIPYVQKYCEHIEKNMKPSSFLNDMMIKIGLKEEDRISIPKDLMSNLFNIGKFFPSEVLNKNASKVLYTVKNKYLKNSSTAELKFDEVYAKSNQDLDIASVFNGLDYGTSATDSYSFDFADIIYYLKYYPTMQSTEKQDAYRALLRDMVENIKNKRAVNFYKKVELANGRTAQQPDMDKIRLFYDLFPISADLVTNITDLDVYFERAIVDEAVLVPGIFTPIVLGKTNNIIAMGDINQLELDLNLQGDLSSQINSIHSTDPKPYPLTYSDTGQQISLFNHLKRVINENDSLKVLVDNFRCRREIFELSQLIQNRYNEYIERYKVINNITTSDFIKYFNSDECIYHFGEYDEIRSPFLFIKEGADKYRNVEELLKRNNVDLDNVFIIVPFEQHIPIVKSMLSNKEITVDVLENLQGRDAEIVIYDSFLENTISDEWRELTMQKFNLIITRTKNLFIFIGDYEICYKTNLSSRTDEPAEVIKIFFREENSQNITMLSIEEENQGDR